MKEARFESMGLPDGLLVSVFSSIAEGDQQAGKPDAMLDAANDAGMAWDAGAKARKAYVAELEKLTGIERKYVTVTSKKTGKTSKSYSGDGAESEGKYGKRIHALLIANDPSVHAALKHLKISDKLTGDEREKAVDNALQGFADSVCRNTDGSLKFSIDLKEVARAKKAETLAQRYKDAAQNIINNGSAAKWVGTFTKEGISFSPFNVEPKGTDDEKNAILASNLTNLAYAIKAREQKKNEEAEKKRQAEYQ